MRRPRPSSLTAPAASLPLPWRRARARRPTTQDDFDDLVTQCIHRNAEATRDYQDCFQGKLHALLVTCALDKCADDARACMVSTCRMQLPPPRLASSDPEGGGLVFKKE